jgi:hypothetical protein
MIKLVDFLKSKNILLSSKDVKIHCATGSSENPPINAFYNNKFKEWQEYQTKKNFQVPFVISIIHLHSDQWLFAGVYKINGDPVLRDDEGRSYYQYDTTLIDGQDDFLGRIIVSFDKKFRASYLRDERYINQLEITQILESRMTIEEFPGFNKVCINFSKLKTIIDKCEVSWKGALSNVKGIYLITDIQNGRHYIGSAIGENGI